MDRKTLQDELAYLTKEHNCISNGLKSKYQVIERENQRLDYIDNRIAQILKALDRLNYLTVIEGGK